MNKTKGSNKKVLKIFPLNIQDVIVRSIQCHSEIMDVRWMLKQRCVLDSEMFNLMSNSINFERYGRQVDVETMLATS